MATTSPRRLTRISLDMLIPLNRVSGTLTALMQCTALQSANSRSLCNADSESLLVIAFP